MLENKHIRKIHCIGVGGIGVGGVAELLHCKGYQVSGSDCSRNNMTDRLKKMGITIFEGHAPEQIREVDLVVYSSAITEDNSEIQAARELGIPVIKRAQMLSELMQNDKSITVSGTHGKTTTTALIAHLLMQANEDPSFMIGGYMNGHPSPSQFGEGQYFVVEADESDASFLFLSSNISIVTNIDADHLETYEGSFSKLEKTFVNFLNKLPDDGLAILGVDDSTVVRVSQSLTSRVATYGEAADADYRLLNYEQEGLRGYFSVKRPRGLPDLRVVLNLPGRHNALNALSVIALADELKIEDEILLAALAGFPGTKRRFNIHGEISFEKGKVLLVDDYGHHPSEIKVTLEAAKHAFPGHRIVLAYQPHRYTRTRDLMSAFTEALSEAHVLLLLGVYSAGEKPIEGADSYALCHAIKNHGKCSPILIPELTELPAIINEVVEEGDILILQGAGSIGGMVYKLLNAHALT